MSMDHGDHEIKYPDARTQNLLKTMDNKMLVMNFFESDHDLVVIYFKTQVDRPTAGCVEYENRYGSEYFSPHLTLKVVSTVPVASCVSLFNGPV